MPQNVHAGFVIFLSQFSNTLKYDSLLRKIMDRTDGDNCLYNLMTVKVAEFIAYLMHKCLSKVLK